VRKWTDCGDVVVTAGGVVDDGADEVVEPTTDVLGPSEAGRCADSE
jgi:hypothetical protein